MYTISRHLENVLKKRAGQSKALLLTGPRQVGKSTLFEHVFAGLARVTFDDELVLAQAVSDPGLFLLNNPAPLVIDEVQRCPSIFSRLKIILDQTDQPGNFFFTGSQKLQLMQGASESLAGRVSIVELSGLSMRELGGLDFNRHFVPSPEYLAARENCLQPWPGDIWQLIHGGAFPELYAGNGREWVDYYASYTNTYLERDVHQIIKARNRLTFVRFLTAVAARTGQMVNYAKLASEVGISEATARDWISILEASGLVYILKPYCPSALHRAIKTPKLYFRDTGLCCYLTRWLTADTLKNGAMAGAMFETFVLNEILKSYCNEGMDYDFSVYYYNGKDKRKRRKDGSGIAVDGEIDLIIDENGILYPVEIKMTASPRAEMAAAFELLDGVPERKRGMGVILCLYDKKLYLRENLVALPLTYL